MKPIKETDLVNTWIWKKHRDDLQWRRVRLGEVATKAMGRMYMVLLRWADAIIVHDGAVYIIEAKLRPAPGAIGQLLLYNKLFKSTPEFSAYKMYPVYMMLLTTMPDLAIAELCTDEGVIYEIFTEKEIRDTQREMLLLPPE